VAESNVYACDFWPAFLITINLLRECEPQSGNIMAEEPVPKSAPSAWKYLKKPLIGIGRLVAKFDGAAMFGSRAVKRE